MSVLETEPTKFTTLFGLQPGDEALLAVAHPDDELLVAMAVKQLVEQGVVVRAIIATEGRASTKGDDETIELVRNGWRRDEMARSLGFLGISAGQQYHLALPDTELQHMDNYRELVAETSAYAYVHGTKAIITVGEVGANHPDHRAVHSAAVASTLELHTAGLDTTIWALSHLGNGDVYIPFAGNFKQELADIHRTQFGTPRDRAELWQYGAAITHLETYREVPITTQAALY